VEAWSVVIPWTGFPLRLLIDQLQPLASARYIKFTTFLDPVIASGQKKRFWEPWPYTEGLRLDEARHDLSFMATGVYGHPLPGQHGAPIRLVVPWKYGFKSIKSIARIEFTREKPETFYTSLSPLEYDFDANVQPDIPYARWHQAFERVPGKEETVKTLPYNGYASQVAGLYL
jgi:sulfoxide reductase catalytic subunit YedY